MMPPHARLHIEVLYANQEDRLLLSEMGAETFAKAFAPRNTPEDMSLYLERSFSPTIQAAELADPDTVFLVAEVGDESVGYARLREGSAPSQIRASHPIEIVRFYARPQWIGRHVGTALMEASLSESRARGCDVVWLDVWEENEKAIAFYKKWGFAEFGTQPFRLGNSIQSDLLMARPVPIIANGEP